MNKAILIGRLTRDAETRYGGQDGQTAIARFTLAVDRQGKDNGADFITCVAFGKLASVMDKFGLKGRKFAVEGHINTGSYKDKGGKTVYTQDVVTEKIEFCDSKSEQKVPEESAPPVDEGFMHVADGLEDEGLPFNA